jgi:hypothetical protein
MAATSQIVHNNATNFSLYYNVLNYFKTIMTNHPSIAHVTQGDAFTIDSKEFPMYPVGNVLIQEANFGSNVTDYTIQLIIADKNKLKNNESVGETNAQEVPFYGVDDVVDIHANTLSVINDLTSYTQRSVEGFEIDGDIRCTPFLDRYDNGLTGWSATFDLKVHNDKNRCLFFLINPSGSYYRIEDCETGDKYNAVTNVTGSIGQVFATNISPNTNPSSYLTSYENIKCFTILEKIEGRDNYDFYNLPILSIPYFDFGNCALCELWTSPKIWRTTPEKWGQGVDVALRKWQYT